MTLSLVARCERTGAVGAVIASASMAVTARCLAVRAGVGAACSQSTTDPRLREALLDAMTGGLAASDALAALVDRTPDIAYRQLAAVDAAGRSASYSGGLALPEATDVCAAGAAAAGNLLADRGVPEAMLAAFQDRAGDSVGDRLIAAIRPAWPRAARSPRCGRPGWSSPSRYHGRSPTSGSTGTTIRLGSSPGSGRSGSPRRSPTSSAHCARPKWPADARPDSTGRRLVPSPMTWGTCGRLGGFAGLGQAASSGTRGVLAATARPSV